MSYYISDTMSICSDPFVPDACAGPVCGISLRQYTNTVIDTSTPKEANFANGGCIYRAGGTSFVVGVTDIK